MTFEENLGRALDLGFSVDFRKSGPISLVTLTGHGTDFPGIGQSPSEALADAVSSVARLGVQ